MAVRGPRLEFAVGAFLLLALASLLNTKLRGIGVFRTLVFSPVVMPVVAWALVWKFLLWRGATASCPPGCPV